jgi:hypothetical protein
MEAALYGKLIISSLAVIVAGWLFQDQADRFVGRFAKFIQDSLTVILIIAGLVCAWSVMAVVWVNN